MLDCLDPSAARSTPYLFDKINAVIEASHSLDAFLAGKKLLPTESVFPTNKVLTDTRFASTHRLYLQRKSKIMDFELFYQSMARNSQGQSQKEEMQSPNWRPLQRRTSNSERNVPGHILAIKYTTTKQECTNNALATIMP